MCYNYAFSPKGVAELHSACLLLVEIVIIINWFNVYFPIKHQVQQNNEAAFETMYKLEKPKMKSLISLFSVTSIKHHDNITLAYDIFFLLFGAEITETKKTLAEAVIQIRAHIISHYTSEEYTSLKAFFWKIMNILNFSENLFVQVQEVAVVILRAYIRYYHRAYFSKVAQELVFNAVDKFRHPLSGMININLIVDNIVKYEGLLALEEKVFNAAGGICSSPILKTRLKELLTILVNCEDVLAKSIAEKAKALLPEEFFNDIIHPLDAAKLPRTTVFLTLMIVILKVVSKIQSLTLDQLRDNALAMLEANAMFSGKITSANIEKLTSDIMEFSNTHHQVKIA